MVAEPELCDARFSVDCFRFAFTFFCQGVKLGVANKVQLGWPEPWWGPRPLELNILWTKFDLPQNMVGEHAVTGDAHIHMPYAESSSSALPVPQQLVVIG